MFELDSRAAAKVENDATRKQVTVEKRILIDRADKSIGRCAMVSSCPAQKGGCSCRLIVFTSVTSAATQL